MKHLINIQQAMNVAKARSNEFGGYTFRNLQDILSVAKPLLKEEGCILTFEDDITEINGEIYHKSTAILKTPDNEFRSTAFAREMKEKKKNSTEQLSGSCITYSRRYALDGLLLTGDADGTLDPDGPDQTKATIDTQNEANAKITSAQIKTLQAAADATNTQLEDVVNHYRPGGAVTDLTARQYGEALNILNKKRMRLEAGA